MKVFIKIGIFISFLMLLNTLISEENIIQQTAEASLVEISQCTLVSLDSNTAKTNRVDNEECPVSFDKIDHTFSQNPDLKHLFPVILKYPIYRPEKKLTKTTSPNISTVFSCPVTHYVFGLRKIII